MKQLFFAALFLLASHHALWGQNKCIRNASFGSAKICVPTVEGYTECYDNEIVKEIADKTEAAENDVLAYYLNHETFGKIDEQGIANNEDFFKLYATKQVKDLKANTDILKEVKDMLTENFIQQQWGEIAEEIDATLSAKIGEPIIVENYSLDKNSFTLVMLVKYEIQDMEPYTMAMTINGYIHAEKLIWMAYYLNYENKTTIERLKKNSNKILSVLVNSDQ